MNLEMEKERDYALKIYKYILSQIESEKKINMNLLLFNKLQRNIKKLFYIVDSDIWESYPCILFGKCRQNYSFTLLDAICYGNLDELDKVLGKYIQYNNLMKTLNSIVKHTQTQ
jgi:hypothetical protein